MNRGRESLRHPAQPAWQKVSAQQVFDLATTELLALRFRSEIAMRPLLPAPNAATYSFALQADVLGADILGAGALGVKPQPLGQGHLAIMYEPEYVPAWQGHFRMVAYLQSPVEPELGGDALLQDVAWSWFCSAMAEEQVEYAAAAGTVSRIQAKSFGLIKHRKAQSALEMRLSWSPQPTAPKIVSNTVVSSGVAYNSSDVSYSLAAHGRAFATMLASLTGLPPVEGLPILSRR